MLKYFLDEKVEYAFWVVALLLLYNCALGECYEIMKNKLISLKPNRFHEIMHEISVINGGNLLDMQVFIPFLIFNLTP